MFLKSNTLWIKRSQSNMINMLTTLFFCVALYWTNHPSLCLTLTSLSLSQREIYLPSSLKENILLSTTAIHMESAEILRNKVNLQCIANGAHCCSKGRGFREQIKYLSVCQLQKQGQAFRALFGNKNSKRQHKRTYHVDLYVAAFHGQI